MILHYVIRPVQSHFLKSTNGTWNGSNMNSNGDFTVNSVGSFDNIYTFTDANGCIALIP